MVLVAYLAVAIVLDIVFRSCFSASLPAGLQRDADRGHSAGCRGIHAGSNRCIYHAESALKTTNWSDTGPVSGVSGIPCTCFQIFITLPGIFLIINSWLAMSAIIPAYIAYRVFVREETPVSGTEVWRSITARTNKKALIRL